MSAHSPLPWRVADEIGSDYRKWLQGDDGYDVCAVEMDCKTDAANLAFIVKAVNNHGKLVGLLRRAYDAIMTGSGQARTAEDIHITLATLMDERP